MENLTRRSVLVGMSTSLIALRARGLRTQSDPSLGLVFIGVYTDQGSKSLGVYSYRWDAQKGELTALGLAAATPNPSFIAIAADRKTLYAANEVTSYKGASDGSISSFSVDTATGKLTAKNVVSSGGSAPCQISLDHSGESAFVANYLGGSIASYKVAKDGSLSAPVASFHYPGHGPDAKRQDTAHAHCVTVSPDNRYLLVNDLGLDSIHFYHLKAATAALAPNAYAAYQSLPKSGPRTFAFHPNGRFAYTTNELANTLDVFHWEPSSVELLKQVQRISTLPADFSGKNTAATVVVDRAGKFVYASNRGDINSIAVFAVNAATGKLTLVQSIDSGGKTPRNFAIDPSGKWIVVAHQDSHTLVVFARDEASGKLTATGRVYPIDWPTCVLFA